jgi:hypothetical protein
MSRWATGLTHLDSAVLGAMFDAGMFPSRPHARTLSAIERIAASKACGEAVAWLQLQALAAEWLPDGDADARAADRRGGARPWGGLRRASPLGPLAHTPT